MRKNWGRHAYAYFFRICVEMSSVKERAWRVHVAQVLGGGDGMRGHDTYFPQLREIGIMSRMSLK